MTEAAVVRSSSCVKATLAVALLATASCSSMSVPTAESIANLPPSGHVTITEEFVTGLGGGGGTLSYQGKTYPFKVIATVLGPGGGLSKIKASGEVYKLDKLADFPGRYTQGTGPAGLNTSASSDLWLKASSTT